MKLFFIFLPLMLFMQGACGGAGGGAAQCTCLAPGLTGEVDDLLAPAHLYDNRHTLFSSYDPGRFALEPAVSKDNEDFGVFERDCRFDRFVNPILLAVRSGEGCPKGVEGLVMAHAEGTGTLSRMWMTVADPFGSSPWNEEIVRIYLDNEKVPRYQFTLLDWSLGLYPFIEPLAGVRSGSVVSYVPLTYQKSLWITLDRVHPKLYYYQFDTLQGELPDLVHGLPFPADGAPHPLDATVSTLYQQEGNGLVTSVLLEADTASAAALGQSVLEFAFDGVTSSAHVGNLCLAGFEWAPFASKRVDVDVQPGRVRCTLRWGWLHNKGGQIRLKVPATTGIRTAITAQDYVLTDQTPGRFFVQEATHATTLPFLHTWADVKGEGRLVALLYNATGEADPKLPFRDPLNFLEGDEVITVDGTPVGHGTGTEDLFNGGFYFKSGPFGWDFGGVSRVGTRANGWGIVQTARYFLGADQINFKQGLTGTIEIGPGHPAIAHDYRTVAIFYVKAK